MFILGTPTQIYKFLAPSERQKEKWENKLKTHIEKEKQAFVEVKKNFTFVFEWHAIITVFKS